MCHLRVIVLAFLQLLDQLFLPLRRRGNLAVVQAVVDRILAVFDFLLVNSLHFVQVLYAKVADGIRCIVIPGSQRVWRKALDEGWLRIFDEAGCVISTPTCGPCLGGHMGILAEGERCVSTTNRNFVGRMGHVKSEVILSGVPVAVASAIKGEVATPDDIL